MAASKIEKYTCKTQDQEEASWGPAPLSNFNGTTGELKPDEPDSLVLGYGQIVPRWDVKTPNRKLQYFTKVDTFPSNDKARLAASKLQEAANEWNALNIGLNIVETNDKASANFYLVYQVNPPDDPNVLAQAFFPHEVGQDVIVFSNAYGADGLPILKNIFEHELGHVLGLRHEFAITGDAAKGLQPEGDGAVQFLLNNYFSIMSYNFPPTMQATDRTQTQEFYKLPNGSLIGGRSPVTDFQPQIRR